MLLLCSVLLGDMLWAVTQVPHKSNADNIVVVFARIGKPP